MAVLDRFVRPLLQSGARRLILATGEKAVLVTAEGPRPVTSQVLSTVQIVGLLDEVLAAARPEAAALDEGFEFPYTTSWGTVRIAARRAGDLARLIIQPEAAAAPAAPAPPTGKASGAVAPPDGAVPVAPSGGAPESLAGGDPAAPRADPAMAALLTKLVAEKCSDLHLCSGSPPLFRKDGDIVPIGDTAPLPPARVHELLLSITPDVHRARFEATHDTDFSYEVPGMARFRCNVFMDRNGMGGVFRVIPTQIPTAEDLGLPPQILELCRLNKGLVVVTGPTGSGKSTTLAAMIDFINKGMSAHIITIEDPIEFVYPNRRCLINQREIGAHTRDFKNALRAALREDPDIVLVGEMRDLETVAIAIETAETGHLVFGTLHTNTAPSAVDRIIDQFPSDRQSQIRTMLSESLRGVIAQTLCKRKGGGRVAALEILIVTSGVGNLIREGKTFQIVSLMQTGRAAGMVTLNDALADLVSRGLVDPVEACNRAALKAEIKALLARQGVRFEAA